MVIDRVNNRMAGHLGKLQAPDAPLLFEATMETNVYLHPDMTGRRLGAHLYVDLLRLSRAQGASSPWQGSR